jgi:hypothetical protein
MKAETGKQSISALCSRHDDTAKPHRTGIIKCSTQHQKNIKTANRKARIFTPANLDSWRESADRKSVV